MKRVRSSPGKTARGGVSNDDGGGVLGCCCPVEGGGSASVDAIAVNESERASNKVGRWLMAEERENREREERREEKKS